MEQEIDKAIRMLKAEYEKALRIEFIRNPLAYALHKVWMLVDRGAIKDAYVRGHERGRRDAKE